MKKLVCAAVCAGTVTCLAGVAIDCSADRVKTNLDVGFKRIGTLVQRGVADIGNVYDQFQRFLGMVACLVVVPIASLAWTSRRRRRR